jgi:hypothetical protein
MKRWMLASAAVIALAGCAQPEKRAAVDQYFRNLKPVTTDPNVVAAEAAEAKAYQDLDNDTLGMFPTVKPSTKAECLSRANLIPAGYFVQRNNVLYGCLDAARLKSQGR